MSNSNLDLRFRPRNGLSEPVDVTQQKNKISTKLYIASVPSFQSRTVRDIEVNGVPVCGVREIDESIKNEDFRRYMTINDMVDFFKRGVPVRIENYKDTEDIYKVIQAHLTQWLETLSSGMNIGTVPVDDLISMEQFAATIYEHARYLITPELIESQLARFMSESSRLNSLNFYANLRGNGKEVTKIAGGEEVSEAPDTPKRDSLLEQFKGAARTMRSYRHPT